MSIDDSVNLSFRCLRALRDAERQMGYPEQTRKRLEEAEAYMKILQTESPLMYRILNKEYLDVWDRCYHEKKVL